jgi:HK97 family phage major capsid protein
MVTSARSAMLQERADLVRENTAMLDRAEAEQRGLSPDETRQFDLSLARIEDLGREIDAWEAQHGSGDQPYERHRTGPGAPARWAHLFGADAAGDRQGFRDRADFLASVHSGLYRPEMLAVMNGATPSAGGFLIPPQFAAEMLDASLEDEIVRPLCRVEPMTGDSKTIAGITHTSGASGPYGGVGGWVAEGSEITAEDLPLRAMTLHAYAVKCLTQVTNEAVADAADLDRQLSAALTKAAGWHLDRAFLRGTGAGQPQGILNAACTITVAKETNQQSGTLVYSNLAKMLARLWPGGFKNAVWVANPTTIPQLLELSVPVGTAGSHVPVVQESGGEYRILTRPVKFTEKAPALGALGDIMLCDFSQYVVGLRADVRLEKSMHAGFTSDTSHYRVVLRADGQPLWDAAYTPNAGDTLSPFVMLEAR